MKNLETSEKFEDLHTLLACFQLPSAMMETQSREMVETISERLKKTGYVHTMKSLYSTNAHQHVELDWVLALLRITVMIGITRVEMGVALNVSLK